MWWAMCQTKGDTEWINQSLPSRTLGFLGGGMKRNVIEGPAPNPGQPADIMGACNSWGGLVDPQSEKIHEKEAAPSGCLPRGPPYSGCCLSVSSCRLCPLNEWRPWALTKSWFSLNINIPQGQCSQFASTLVALGHVSLGLHMPRAILDKR